MFAAPESRGPIALIITELADSHAEITWIYGKAHSMTPIPSSIEYVRRGLHLEDTQAGESMVVVVIGGSHAEGEFTGSWRGQPLGHPTGRTLVRGSGWLQKQGRRGVLLEFLAVLVLESSRSEEDESLSIIQ